MTIRSYQPQDHSQIVTLFDEFQDYLVSLDPLQRLRRLPGYGEYYLQKTLDEVAANDGIFKVAADLDDIVGFATGIVMKLTQGDLFELVPSIRGRITELFVRLSHRGQGIGTRLMQDVEAYLVQHGCDVIRVGVFVPNQNAHQFYKNLGYQDMDIRRYRK